MIIVDFTMYHVSEYTNYRQKDVGRLAFTPSLQLEGWFISTRGRDYFSKTTLQ